MDDGHIVVDSIEPMRLGAITDALARESGFTDVKDLLQTAKHGAGDNVYLIRFRYLPPGGWDLGSAGKKAGEAHIEAPAGPAARGRSDLLRRIRQSKPPRRPVKAKAKS